MKQTDIFEEKTMAMDMKTLQEYYVSFLDEQGCKPQLYDDHIEFQFEGNDYFLRIEENLQKIPIYAVSAQRSYNIESETDKVKILSVVNFVNWTDQICKIWFETEKNGIGAIVAQYFSDKDDLKRFLAYNCRCIQGTLKLFEEYMFGCEFNSSVENQQKIDFLIEIGVKTLQKGDFDKAFHFFALALEIEPDNITVLKCRALAFEYKGEFDGVIADLTRTKPLAIIFADLPMPKKKIMKRLSLILAGRLSSTQIMLRLITIGESLMLPAARRN